MRSSILVVGILSLLVFAAVGSAEVIHLEFEDYKAGANDNATGAYYDTDTGNNGDAYRTAAGEDVDIQATEDDGGGFNVGWTKAGEWLQLTTDPTTWAADPIFAGGNYLLEARLAAKDTNLRSIQVDVDGQSISLSQNASTGWQNWVTVSTVVSGISAGSHPVKVTLTDGDQNLNWLRFTSPVPEPSTLLLAGLSLLGFALFRSRK